MSERTLILAIIQRAVEDTQINPLNFKSKHRISKKRRVEMQRIREDTIQWFSSEYEGEYSLRWWCQLIELDAEWVRRKVRENGGTQLKR